MLFLLKQKPPAVSRGREIGMLHHMLFVDFSEMISVN